MLCRSIVRRHYSQFGTFRALANQPGVEFHLKLTTVCDLGAPPQWFGWQCKWYDVENGENIGAARRQQIKESLEKTEKHLPGVTDWILWTRHILTKSDQEWFFALSTGMKLHLWSGIDVEDRLTGPAAILRETYFGQLVLTPESLKVLHDQAVAPIRQRWLPEVHQVLDAEREVHRTLGEIEAWSILRAIQKDLDDDIAGMKANLRSVPAPLNTDLQKVIGRGREASSALAETHELLSRGQYEILIEAAINDFKPSRNEQRLLRQLRSGRSQVALYVTNLLADMTRAQRMLSELREAIEQRLVIVVADAGCGKTQMSAQITAATPQRSAGLLLRGKQLAAGQDLNQLAQRTTIRGTRVESFESLVAAVDAAAERQGRRLPIVIDGLNEAEDPRDWKDQLASLNVLLSNYTNIQIICTLRSAFVTEALPEGSELLEIPGFNEDLHQAIRRYFQFYKIDAADAELPWELLNHPLTLRMFCDVTNPERKQTVGVGAIPASLTNLFDQYLDQVAKRVAELSPASKRIFQADVHEALNKIGMALWDTNAREVDTNELRKLLGDEASPWDQSLVAALENDGILFREPGTRSGRGSMSILYDALAGHIIANSLLDEHSGSEFDRWIRNAKTAKALLVNRVETPSRVDTAIGYIANRLPEDLKWKVWNFRNRLRASRRRYDHPLAYDIFRALVGLTPYKIHGKQLWPYLQGNLRIDAIVEAAYINGALLDHETVSQIAELVRAPSNRHRDLLNRMFVTRAALAHPLNADFLDSILRPMQVPDRDLRWSEWIRRRDDSAKDFQRLQKRWKDGNLKGKSDLLRARWVMWTLTSTNRSLRDNATYALYQFGCSEPEGLFELTIDSLRINDPYVPERMLAACYGVAMSLWADPKGSKVRDAIPAFAKLIAEKMFAPNAPHSTCHALTRGYATGIIALARKIDTNCISAEVLAWLKPSQGHFSSPFPPASEIKDGQISGAEYAIGMDFGNYTLGRLVKGRSNYDFENAAYKEVRRKIEYRIVSLGYSLERFKNVDNMISSDRQYAANRDKGKTDRYGKKYAWIAFFEMYGLQFDKGEIEDYRESRPSDVDIDPSFPEAEKIFKPNLADIFSSAPTTLREWITDGPTPDYSGYLQSEEIDGLPGPWVLLQGFIEESAQADSRRVFSFLRGIIVKRSNVSRVLDVFNSIEYPGNQAIPEPMGDHYTFAGEIPWSQQFASGLRDAAGNAIRDVREAFDYHDGRKWVKGIEVEVPVCRFAWESYHSELNQVSGVDVPAPSLCESLGLLNRKGEWDFYDSSGRIATLYREFKDADDSIRSHLFFMRADLMAEYLGDDFDLLWFVWGERNLHYKELTNLRSEIQDAFQGHRHIHKFSRKWPR
jgi:hypothetical protein